MLNFKRKSWDNNLKLLVSTKPSIHISCIFFPDSSSRYAFDLLFFVFFLKMLNSLSKNWMGRQSLDDVNDFLCCQHLQVGPNCRELCQRTQTLDYI